MPIDKHTKLYRIIITKVSRKTNRQHTGTRTACFFSTCGRLIPRKRNRSGTFFSTPFIARHTMGAFEGNFGSRGRLHSSAVKKCKLEGVVGKQQLPRVAKTHYNPCAIIFNYVHQAHEQKRESPRVRMPRPLKVRCLNSAITRYEYNTRRPLITGVIS